ncbi:MIP/aquaporin family protein [Actinotalea sp.]|uniref:MIP/aquaporin family protein n=1 Tax=Actinotalea sp. TaxID=1872145 RepID=UPI0035648118
MSTPEPTPPAASDADESPVAETAMTLEVESFELSGLETVAYEEEPSLLARVGAETFGSFAFVLVTVGALLYTQLSGVGTLGVALAAGLVLAGLTHALGGFSGAHLNPAVSVAAAITGRTPTVDAVLYVAGQVLGAITAVAVLVLTVPAGLPEALGTDSAVGLMATTANGYDALSPLSTLSSGQFTFGLVAALVVELLGTIVLVAVVLANRARRSGAVAVGLTFAALLLLVAPVTNGALNPARATAVAIVSVGSDTTALAQLWLFWLTGLVGGAVVGLALLAFGRRELTTEDQDLLTAEPVEDVQDVRLD